VTTHVTPSPVGITPYQAANPLVECSQLSRTFGTGHDAVHAVRAVDCVIRVGARVAITGPSGSGKSTLLHLMAGLEHPTGGSITWPGLGDGPVGHPQLLGMVFQGPSLLPALDVVENVALPRILAGQSDAHARAEATAALDRLGLSQLQAKLPEELSGGQAQRVAIARVLAGRPALILADEPTGQLDSTTGAKVIEVLLEVAAEVGAALVISTHDPEVAARFELEWSMRDGNLLLTNPKNVQP